jgi:protein-tyrosine phosphatase
VALLRRRRRAEELSGIKKVLFVCTGNICRSAMAEHLLRHLSKTKNLGLEVRSCGTAADSYFEVPEIVHKLLTERGVEPFEHTARLVTREPLAWADLVLAMTAGHAEQLREKFPEFSSKIRVFREQAGFGEEDVADPMGLSDEEFAQCLEVIEEGFDALIPKGFKE